MLPVIPQMIEVAMLMKGKKKPSSQKLQGL